MPVSDRYRYRAVFTATLLVYIGTTVVGVVGPAWSYIMALLVNVLVFFYAGAQFNWWMRRLPFRWWL